MSRQDRTYGVTRSWEEEEELETELDSEDVLDEELDCEDELELDWLLELDEEDAELEEDDD